MSEAVKKDQRKTERFNMFMSPSDLDSIEEWQFANKVASKSEAVRQLCQIGLTADREFQELASNCLHAYITSTKVLDSLVERNRPSGTNDFSEFVDRYLASIKDLIELSREIGDLSSKAQRVSLSFRDQYDKAPEAAESSEDQK